MVAARQQSLRLSSQLPLFVIGSLHLLFSVNLQDIMAIRNDGSVNIGLL